MQVASSLGEVAYFLNEVESFLQKVGNFLDQVGSFLNAVASFLFTVARFLKKERGSFLNPSFKLLTDNLTEFEFAYLFVLWTRCTK